MVLQPRGAVRELAWFPGRANKSRHAGTPGYRTVKALRDGQDVDEHGVAYVAASTAEWTNIMQQQLPPGHSLQPLLQPLLQPSTGATNNNNTVPGDDIGPIAADSTSLAVGMAPTAMPSVQGLAPSLAVPADLSSTLSQKQQQVPAAPTAKLLSSHWVKQVVVVAFAAMLCYLDRTNISTAIVPMVSVAKCPLAFDLSILCMN